MQVRILKCRPLLKVTALRGMYYTLKLIKQYRISLIFFLLALFRYPGLSIKYVRGADPVIKLLDEDGDVVEVKANGNWKGEKIS